MDDSRGAQYQHLLHALEAPPQLREEIFASSSFKLVNLVCELCLNVLYGQLIFEPNDKNILRRYKSRLEILADESKKYTKKVQALRGAEPELLDILRDILKRNV
jgi:hypothetical protein